MLSRMWPLLLQALFFALPARAGKRLDDAVAKGCAQLAKGKEAEAVKL